MTHFQLHRTWGSCHIEPIFQLVLCRLEKVRKTFGLLYAHAQGAVTELRLATDLLALQSSGRIGTSHFFLDLL